MKTDQTTENLHRIIRKIKPEPFKRITNELGLIFIDEITGEYLDSNDLINEQKKNFMSNENNNNQQQPVYPEGILFFEPSEAAKKYTDGDIVINPRTLVEWIKANPSFLTDNEKYGKQLKLKLSNSKNGKRYLQVNTWKPAPAQPEQQPEAQKEGLPF